MSVEEIALYLMEAVDEDNGVSNRYESKKLDEVHNEWVEDFKMAIRPAFMELCEDFFTEEFCDEFATGDVEFVNKCIKEHPKLVRINFVLTNYFDNL